MKRWLIILCGLFISTQLSAWETKLILYRPFIRLNEGLLQIKHKVDSQCFKPSEKIIRQDAWSCETNSEILDPCFINAAGDSSQMLCPQSPWQSSAILLNVPSLNHFNLHTEMDMSKQLPWAVELENGTHCLRTHKSGYIDNLPVNYQCQNHQQLIGGIQRCKEQWTSLLASQEDIDEVRIKKVWF